MVSNPNSFATRATTGLEPVPVPPPMLAVTKTILVPSSKSLRISSILDSASERPFSGLPPAPSPSPSISFTGTGEGANDLLSVLHATNETPVTCSSYMLRTALQPPPPTPTTLMMLCDKSSTTSKSIIPLSFIFLYFFCRKVTILFSFPQFLTRLAKTFLYY